MAISDNTIAQATKAGRKNGNLAKAIGYFTAFITLGLISGAIGPTLPSLAEHTGSTLSAISVLFILRSLGYILGSVRLGKLYDRIPGHKIMAAAVALMMLIAALIPAVPRLWLLAAILFLMGLGESLTDVGGNTLLVWVYGRKAAPYLNGLHFFFGLGAFIAPIIVAQAMLMTNDIYWAYWTLAILLLPVIIYLFRLPSPVVQNPEAVKKEESPGGKIDIWLVVLIGAFFFFHVGAEASFGGWIYTYAVKLNLTNTTIAAYLTSAFWGSMTIGRLVAIPISARVRPRYILFGDLSGCLVGLMVILIWSGSLTATFIGTFILGVSIGPLFANTISLAERRMKLTGKVTGWFFIGTSTGSMIIPWLIGQMIDNIGPRSMMVTSVVAIVLAILMLGILITYSEKHLQPGSSREI